MLAYFGYLSVPTPTHGQALLALAVLLACLPGLILLTGVLGLPRARTPGDFIEGVCGRCGYDLRGLHGTICPECGADTAFVGTRRPRQSLRGAWITCTLWIALLLWFHSYFKREIEEYILRLIWHVEYTSGWGLTHHPTKMLRLASLVALMVIGPAIIIWFSRRRGARMT